MKIPVEIKNNQIITSVNINDGVYDCDIKLKEQNRTLQQINFIWAIIDDISRAQYGNTKESENIYFQILQMSGVNTQRYVIREELLDELASKVKTYKVTGREVVDGHTYLIVNACNAGISTMSKQELSRVIDNTLMYASEAGIILKKG